MNILHMKYAVEVARLGSLNRAAESLLIAQPNISRSIKELEADLGITIFNRSSRGMSLTDEGEEFIGYARAILEQIDRVERHYHAGVAVRAKFSAAVPSGAYLSAAIARFIRTPEAAAADITYRYATAQRTLELVQNGECRLGVMRYAEPHSRAVKALLEERGMAYELIAEFSPVLVMHADSPLAGLDKITAVDLADCVEILPVEEDTLLPPGEKSPRDARAEHAHCLRIDGQSNRCSLLEADPRTYMLTSPTAKATLDRMGLVQRTCADLHRSFCDVLIYRAGYKLSAADMAFITAMCAAKREHFPAL